MLKISPAQWNRMGRSSFDARLVAYIRKTHPDQASRVDDDALSAAVRRQAPRARRYGLSDERSIATYIYTAWLLGEEFDERVPALSQILREPTMSPSTKASALIKFSAVVFALLESPAAAATARPAPAP